LIHLAVEQGLVGVLGVALWAWSVRRGLAVGDPWTAALAAGLVNSMLQFPAWLPHTGLALLCVVAVVARHGG
jgi:hypothetical protein